MAALAYEITLGKRPFIPADPPWLTSRKKSKLSLVHAKISKARMQTLTEKMRMETLTEKYLPADRTSGLVEADLLATTPSSGVQTRQWPLPLRFGRIVEDHSKVVVPTDKELMTPRRTLPVLDANHSKERELLCAGA